MGPHGVAGLLKVLPWCDNPAFLTDFETLYLDESGEKALKIEKAGVHKNVVLLKILGIDNIEDAENLRDCNVYINRDDIALDDGQYFIADLMGAEVYDETEKFLGKISKIDKLPANDVWSIENNGKTHLFPAVSEFIVSVDIAKSRVIINPIEGIFDDD